MLPNLVPKEISIIPEKVYDTFWVEEIIISSYNLNGETDARIKLKKFGIFNGIAEFMPGDPGITMSIENLLAKSASDPELANIINSLLLYIKKSGIEQGIISGESV
jgi:hypothetical protein